ncbi:hypothetical protein ACI5KX_05905 [Erythrobacter sp. GH1-10]|uniref:hypothetical protein n=1 Tax=Erythrobacter sp. GH1-10 TaxID=3349334 RepID=UPI0038781728
MGGTRIPRGQLVPGFTICFAPGFTVGRNENILFSMHHRSVLAAANNNTQYACYNEDGQAYTGPDPSIRSTEPVAVIPFFVDATIADQIAGMQQTAPITGFMAYSGYTSRSSASQAHRRGQGRLTRVPKQIVDQIANALRANSPVPSATGLDQDFRGLLEQVDNFRGSNFATAMDRISSIVMPWRDRVFVGYLNFRGR